MKEMFDGYICLADYCDKELQDGQPPCSDCGNLIFIEQLVEMQENLKNNK